MAVISVNCYESSRVLVQAQYFRLFIVETVFAIQIIEKL